MDCLPKRFPLSLLFLFLVLGVRSTGAQVPDEGPTSIGFANPDSTQPVRAYRLPTWHWSRWILRANGQANLTSQSSESALQSEENEYQTRLRLRPRYRGFWESEERRFFLRFSPRISLGRSGSNLSPDRPDREVDPPDVEEDDLQYDAGFGFQGTLREYVTDRAFLLTDAEGLLDYSNRQFTREASSDRGPSERNNTAINFFVRTDLRLGIGVGRVRVVTPVIRALRMRERLRVVAPGTSVPDQQVQAAAGQLARRPGYRSVYDRSDKYFWRDFFETIGGSQQSPFETFYVADVLREPVGVRREGSEFTIGPSGSYERDLRRTEEDGVLEERDFDERGTVGGFAHGQWYRNISLRHQLGADVKATYTHFVDSRGPLDHEVGGTVEGQWLWVVADRIRLDTRLRANLRHRNDSQEDALQSQTRSTLSSDVIVFVENSLRLTAGAEAGYEYVETSSRSMSEFRTGLRFNVNYVLTRALE